MPGFLRGRRDQRARRERWRRRAAALLLALLATQLGSLLAPAYACGCGALVPGDERRVAVHREVSVVRWDGEREQIVMSLSVTGDADRAAWIMPVPSRATVRLGDAEVFSQLTEATAPEERARYHFWPQDGDWPLSTGDGAGAAAPPAPGAGPGVGVVGRERLGPFDVARLTATDPAALDDWLGENGFAFPPRLESALQPYVDRRWEYVAVRLTPETAGAPLRGDLEPLHLAFASGTLVYPMRLSRLATSGQSLVLYVLAGHRMEPVSRIGGERPRVTFAGPVGTTAGPLGALADGAPFLTALAQEFPDPSSISADHELRRTAKDTAFRQVVYDDRLLRVAGVPAWLVTVVGGLVALVTTTAVLGARRGRTRRRHPGERPPTGPTAPGGYPTPPAGAAAPGGCPAPPARPTTPGAPPVPPAAPTAPGTPPAAGGVPATPGDPPRPPARPAAPGGYPEAPARPAAPDGRLEAPAAPATPGTPPAAGAGPAVPGAAPVPPVPPVPPSPPAPGPNG
ncbi:DUF2330 domain-containing protein [Streptomyces sp. NPDC017936]|uniref:DUF2330 domain-containing protein n=1 Tax=Streptomyces sp. NPDC017936 TaxID=3365016 RepID=UPI0037A176CE